MLFARLVSWLPEISASHTSISPWISWRSGHSGADTFRAGVGGLAFCISNKPRSWLQCQSLDRPSCSIDPRANEDAKRYPWVLLNSGATIHPEETGKDKPALSGMFQKGWGLGMGLVSILRRTQGRTQGVSPTDHTGRGRGSFPVGRIMGVRQLFPATHSAGPKWGPGRDSSHLNYAHTPASPALPAVLAKRPVQ